MTEPLEFVAVTTLARIKRHWSLPKTGPWGHHQTLCGSGNAYDQEHIDSSRLISRRHVVIADLPPCLQCDKSRKRREDERKDLAKALRESLEEARSK